MVTEHPGSGSDPPIGFGPSNRIRTLQSGRTGKGCYKSRFEETKTIGLLGDTSLFVYKKERPSSCYVFDILFVKFGYKLGYRFWSSYLLVMVCSMIAVRLLVKPRENPIFSKRAKS